MISSQGGAPAIVVSNDSPAINPSVALEGRLPENPGEVAIDQGRRRPRGPPASARTTSPWRPPSARARDARRHLPLRRRRVDRRRHASSSSPSATRSAGSTARTRSPTSSRRPSRASAQNDLANRIQAVLAGDLQVETAAENAQAQSDDIAGEISGFLDPVLLAFAGVALFVGAFIIFNTFSITVAQRVREFGMIRTLGATRAPGDDQRASARRWLVGVVASRRRPARRHRHRVRGSCALFDAIGFGLPAAGIDVRRAHDRRRPRWSARS